MNLQRPYGSLHTGWRVDAGGARRYDRGGGGGAAGGGVCESANNGTPPVPSWLFKQVERGYLM
jgi:hypothetical protein